MKTILLLGSAPDAIAARDFDSAQCSAIVAVNNAWRIRTDWTHLVFPDDFPPERRPSPVGGQYLISADQYVPANNAYGGIIYAGATMAFSAAYWILHALKPDMIVFRGCDMIYDRKLGHSHFYGRGTADPLRKDPTLQLLEAKATRLMLLAARQGCLCANLNTRPDSRLTFPRLNPALLGENLSNFHDRTLSALLDAHDAESIDKVLDTEKHLYCYAPTGDYWNTDIEMDEIALRNIDLAWRGTAHRNNGQITKIA